jgi:hypothetical protein
MVEKLLAELIFRVASPPFSTEGLALSPEIVKSHEHISSDNTFTIAVHGTKVREC